MAEYPLVFISNEYLKLRTIRLLIIGPLQLFLFLGATNAKAQNPQDFRSDSQEWNDVQLSIPITRAIDFNILGVLRIGRDIHRPVDERIAVGFSVKVGKYLTLAPNYLHISTQPFRNVASFENRLTLPITIRFPIGQFRFSDRNMFERRMRHPGINSTRYRNKLQVEHPIGPKKINLSVFVADEFYYDWAIDAWTRNRIQVGVSRIFNRHFTGDIYYLRQSDSHSLPGDLNVLGTSVRLRM